MRTRRLPAAEWGPYIDRVAEAVRWSRVTVEVLDPARKRVTEASEALLECLWLDPETCDLRLAGPDLDHTVPGIASFSVLEDVAGALTAFEAQDTDGIRHVATLRAPRRLSG